MDKNKVENASLEIINVCKKHELTAGEIMYAFATLQLTLLETVKEQYRSF